VDYLRLILLFAGLALIAGIYVWGKSQRSRQAQRQEPPIDSDAELGLKDLPTMDTQSDAFDSSATEIDLDEIGPMSAIDEPIVIEPDPIETTITAEEPSLSVEPAPVEEPAAAAESQQEVDRVVALYIVAPRDLPYAGPALLAAFASVGLEHGAMRVYHHRVEGGGVFSLASLVEPGYFEPESMDESYTTPGLSLFMPLPGGGDALKTLDSMLELAHQLTDQLGGELRDESKSVLSRQTASHMREEVQDYLLHRKLEQRKSGH